MPEGEPKRDEQPKPSHYERFRQSLLARYPETDEDEIRLQYRDWILGVDE
jgi:hypothetical protein